MKKEGPTLAQGTVTGAPFGGPFWSAQICTCEFDSSDVSHQNM